MPKRSSTLQHSKVVERQVVRYLWGPDAARAWKEQHDLAGAGLLQPALLPAQSGQAHVDVPCLYVYQRTVGNGRQAAPDKRVGD